MDVLKNKPKIMNNLSGHSGCSLFLMQKESEIFVRKTSSDEKYNFRLKKQCKKQSAFLSQNRVLAPEILECGFEGNLFYFDMQYIQGKTMAEYTSNILITEIADFIRCLFKCLYISDDNPNPKANCIFLNKIESIEYLSKTYSVLEEPFRLLKSHDWSRVYKSPCHGDLTLENIIITKDKNLYLIDFLDSFYNSWMIDIAKLLQDLDLKWSFRKQELTSNRALRLQVAKEALIEEILLTENGIENLKTIYYLLLLNVIRIYPYVKDDETLSFLNNSVGYLMNKLEKEIIGVNV